MNSFELHESACYIADTHSAYTLAKAWLQCDEKRLLEIERNDRLYTDLERVMEQLAEYQRIYGTLGQSDYLRRT